IFRHQRLDFLDGVAALLFLGLLDLLLERLALRHQFLEGRHWRNPSSSFAGPGPGAGEILRAIQAVGGTYPLGRSAPPPKKKFSIWRARYWRARWSARLRRFSFTSIVWCFIHAAQPSLLTEA